jgi:hypothetical protein
MKNMYIEMEKTILNKLRTAKVNPSRASMAMKAENPRDFFVGFHNEMKTAFNQEMSKRRKYVKKSQQLIDLCKNWLSPVVEGL